MDLKEAFRLLEFNNINIINNLDEKRYNEDELKKLKKKIENVPLRLLINDKDANNSESEDSNSKK